MDIKTLQKTGTVLKYVSLFANVLRAAALIFAIYKVIMMSKDLIGK